MNFQPSINKSMGKTFDTFLHYLSFSAPLMLRFNHVIAFGLADIIYNFKQVSMELQFFGSDTSHWNGPKK